MINILATKIFSVCFIGFISAVPIIAVSLEVMKNNHQKKEVIKKMSETDTEQTEEAETKAEPEDEAEETSEDESSDETESE